GEEAFFTGLRRYFEAHRFANATLDDFLSAIEQASGRDLRQWARVWLQTASVNTLSVALQEAPSPAGGATISRLTIHQTAPEDWPTLRPHRIAIGLYDPTPAGLELRRRVEVDITGAETPVPELEGERRPALILPNDGDLTYAKVRLDRASLATARAQLSRFTDPLPRAILWDTAWDMVLDAQLTASEFVEWVCTHADGESQLTVVMLVIRQALRAADLYAAPEHRAQLLDQLAARAQQGLAAAAPSSDRQLTWTRALISAARTPAALATIAGLLDGTTVVPGLTVDTDLRWRIIGTLLAQGAAGAELADAELVRDRTDEGRRRALAARAARPDAGAKEEAWAQMVEATDLPIANLRALMTGFLRYEQGWLVEPFVDRYLDQVGPMWQRQPVEVALEFAEGLYPRPVVSAHTIERTDARLADAQLPPALRRLLLEGRDDVRRALRARQVDAGL
ncbi:MAG TPA: M1 family metallopeptidase, partial [Candidatus Dormibacteraeota bacterium]|nr:M1 family metallopeptidase [Candidatus Dormibacteraeota bacterium]